MLVVDGVTVRFGGVEAVRRVSTSLEPGRVLGLIGPNGSGKTTLLNTLCGVHPPAEGSVSLDGVPLAGLEPSAVASRGITRTFQVPRVFETLTLLENMLLPTIGRGASRDDDPRGRAESLLEFVSLGGRGDEVASLLSGGQQKLLEFARALMTEPRVVLMDEPFAGVHPSLIRVMTDRIARRRDSGTSFVIVSHEIPPLLEVSDTLVCMSTGEVVSAGPVETVIRDERVIEAYLGRTVDERSRAQRGAVDA